MTPSAHGVGIFRFLSILLLSLGTAWAQLVRPVDHAKQGTIMKVQLCNVGAFGKISYPPFWLAPSPPPESLGLEYPVAGFDPIEHVYGAGLWVGGLRDTSATGGGVPLRGVSTVYEGWEGPYYEFFPGTSPADTIWKSSRLMPGPPPGWDAYWGPAFPYRPVSDQDYHCVYTDTSVAISQHRPLGVKVIQSSYCWFNTSAAGMMIIEFRIFNVGPRPLDSVYVSFFLDGDVGPITVPQYFSRNYSASLRGLNGAYIYNPFDTYSTPVGTVFLGARRGGTNLAHAYRSFQWFDGYGSPRPDARRYQVMRADTSRPDEFPDRSDTRFLLTAGPFTLEPAGPPPSDPLVVAFALLGSPQGGSSGIEILRTKAFLAQELYSSSLFTSVFPLRQQFPSTVHLEQNFPNPFNPATTIAFELPRASHTVLAVYDLLGRRLRVLVDGHLESGRHEVSYKDEGLASGVLFYRLAVEGQVLTRKMVLQK